MVSRNGTVMPEYTTGKDDMAPLELELAKKRFKARNAKVAHYYKKMGLIYNLSSSFIAYPVSFVGVAASVFKIPFILVSDYRYEHSPEYKKKIDALEMERVIKEKRAQQKLRDELNAFIKQELEKEGKNKTKRDDGDH